MNTSTTNQIAYLHDAQWLPVRELEATSGYTIDPLDDLECPTSDDPQLQQRLTELHARRGEFAHFIIGVRAELDERGYPRRAGLS